MENKVLQQFLDAGVFEIGDKVKHIEASIVDLSKFLVENKKSIPAYMLVALDSNTSPSGPVFSQTEEIVKVH